MTTTRGIGIGALVLGASVFGGWWSSRAAAPESVHQPATVGADDDRLHKLLDEVHRRSVELDQRDRELAERSAALESLEQAVDDALGDLESRGGTGAGVSGPCKLRGGVARIYESMRPEEAAQILDQLDDDTLRTVFARMEAKQIAAIVAAMSRERAVAFTRTLAADPEPAPARAPTARP